VLTLGPDQKVEIDPRNATSYYQLGLRYLRNDEAEAAVVALQQAITLHPRSDVTHLFLGLAYTWEPMSRRRQPIVVPLLSGP